MACHSKPLAKNGRRAFLGRRSCVVKHGGALGSENVGMSSDNSGEKPEHRKPKVSWATLIVPGLVGPKLNPKGVGDGQQVNIPVLLEYHQNCNL